MSLPHPPRAPLPSDFDRPALSQFTPVWEHTAQPPLSPPAGLTREERLHDNITGWLGVLGALFVMGCILASLLLIVRVVNTTSDAPGPLEALLPGAFWVDSAAASALLFVLVTGLVLLMRRKRAFYAWPIVAGILSAVAYVAWRALNADPACEPGALGRCAGEALRASHLYIDPWAWAITLGFATLLGLLILSPRARKTLRQ